jgi:hypothetical protein
VAYGTHDRRYKYSIGGLWLVERQPRTYLFASYTSDMDRTTNYYDKVSFDNIVNFAIRKKGIPYKLIFSDEARFEFYKEYNSGFSHMLTALQKSYDPYEPLPSNSIFTNEAGQPVNSIQKTEFELKLRYAYKERFIEGHYYRVSLGSKYPIVQAKLAVGVKGLFNGGYNYQKLNVSASDDIKIAPFGSLYLNIFAGKYFGTLPYILLENHPGNETYFYNKYSFSLITNFEYLSDRYAGFNLEHSLGGGVFKYIPLIRKMKLRQFWTAKTIIGNLSDANRDLNLNKGYTFRTLENTPYVELGTGIENILRLFRLDFVWRVLPQPMPAEDKSKYYGVFASFKLDF